MGGAGCHTHDEWLDALLTSGGAIPESRLADLLEGVGDAIDAVGGIFTMNYVTFVVTAVRHAEERRYRIRRSRRP